MVTATCVVVRLLLVNLLLSIACDIKCMQLDDLFLAKTVVQDHK